MQYFKYMAGILLTLLFVGCTAPNYEKENSAYIVLKTPTFKYADMGFVYENKEEVKVEIYGSGQALMTLKVSKGSVCMHRLQCMSKEAFNTQVLSGAYPPDIIENIFRGKPIFEGVNMTKKSNGFTQKIKKTGKYRIEYAVLNNQILFHDTINEILIKVIKQ